MILHYLCIRQAALGNLQVNLHCARLRWLGEMLYIHHLFKMKDVIIRVLVLLALVSVPVSRASADGRMDSIYACLDEAIRDSSAYAAEREGVIDGIRARLAKAGDDASRYAVAFAMYKEYKPFMNDSALTWLRRAEGFARRAGDKAGENRCRALMAYQCSTTGMYTESADILATIDKSALSREGLVDYYMACNHLYSDLGYYTKVDALRDVYHKKAGAYADSLLSVADKYSDIALQLLETRAYNEGDYVLALRYNDTRLRLAEKDSHRLAIVAFYRYLDYKKLGGDEWVYWLAVSALTDVRNAVMDQAALWELANHLYVTGDIERSYGYINFAAICASKFSTRLRNLQITPVMQVIDNIYQMQNKRENAYLKAAIVLTSLFLLLLLAFLAYVNRHRKRLAQARNELSAKNGQLTALNAEMKQALDSLDKSNRRLTATGGMLNDAVASLDESNRVKEKYIGLFLRQCSSYIDRMDSMRREQLALIKGKRYAELYDMVKTHDFRDKEQEELFEIFDSTFIRLFPTFVDEFNRLLLPQNRIQLTDNSKLNTGIRIFALIRLGIDDSSKIAEFLHYSVNTIYNYRAKIKNGAAVGRDEFEDLVKAIGSPKPYRGG